MLDNVVTMRAGEQRPVFVRVTGNGQNLTITDAPSYRVYDGAGSVVAGPSPADYDSGAGTPRRVWANIDTAALTAGAVYSVRFSIEATGATDGLVRQYERVAGLVLEPATGVQPSRTRYPHAYDLWLFLDAAGLLPTTDAGKGALATQVGNAVAAGKANFELVAGRYFLAGSSATKRFDPPTGREGLLSLPDLATLASVVYEPYQQTAETLDEWEDYVAERWREGDTTTPITWLRFHRRWGAPLGLAQRQSLKVTGTWGYGTAVPADAWAAMLAGGALWLAEQVVLRQTGGRLGYKEGDVSEDFGVETWQNRLSGWQAQVRQAASLYRRMSL